ncbi:MAG: OmpA family protein [Granulosicoccus sp.]
MNFIKFFVLLIGSQFLVSCASKGQTVTGTEGAGKTALEKVAERLPTAEDADADGIVDTSDNCPVSASGVLVDESGCEIVTGVIEGLKFGPNESKLSVDSRIVLSKLVDGFKRYPDVVIAVEGHTDNRGSAAANLELSKQRVLSVVRYMVTNGIDPKQVKPYGYGESKPRAANATAQGREQNRRIEIKVVDRLL